MLHGNQKTPAIDKIDLHQIREPGIERKTEQIHLFGLAIHPHADNMISTTAADAIGIVSRFIDAMQEFARHMTITGFISADWAKQGVVHHPTIYRVADRVFRRKSGRSSTFPSIPKVSTSQAQKTEEDIPPATFHSTAGK